MIRLWRWIYRFLKNNFLAGIATIFPLFITFYIIYLIFTFSEQVLGTYINSLLMEHHQIRIPGLGLAFVLALVLIAGYLSRNFIGRITLPLIDKVFRRLPIISQIYPPAKQFSDIMFNTDQKKELKKVVMVPYPTRGSYTIGFVTNKGIGSINAALGSQSVGVLVPFSPTPFTGVLLFFPEDHVVDVDLSIEDAVKVIISAGVVSPKEADGDDQ